MARHPAGQTDALISVAALPQAHALARRVDRYLPAGPCRIHSIPCPRPPQASPLPRAAPMPKTPILQTRNKMAKLYAIGILVFSAVVAFITLLAYFLARVNVN
jgi:hypothetical protein